MSSTHHTMDMCSGPLFSKIIRYAIPLAITYILQLMFNAVDLIIVGQFASHESTAAIGTTTEIMALMINLFVGISIGANVLAARAFGANNLKDLSKITHTAVAVSGICGIILMILGELLCVPILHKIQVPPEVLPLSCTYVRICFVGIPFLMIYNFCCAILRAVGDTKRPLYFLCLAGGLNVLLTYLFVAHFKLNVTGAALATIISQSLSAFLVLRTLLRSTGAIHLNVKQLRIEPTLLRQMLLIGIPAGMQSVAFNFSNIIIQSAINTFGSEAMAGMTATLSLEWVLYAATFSLHHTVISFVGQNYGAQHYQRAFQSMKLCLACSVFFNTIIGWLMYFNGEFLLSIFNPNPEVIRWGMMRISVSFTVYFILSFMDIASGSLRGLGYSFIPALSTLVGACLFRVFWVFVIFAQWPQMHILMLSYPISWGITAIFNCALLIFVCKKILRDSDRHNFTMLKIP